MQFYEQFDENRCKEQFLGPQKNQERIYFKGPAFSSLNL